MKRMLVAVAVVLALVLGAEIDAPNAIVASGPSGSGENPVVGGFKLVLLKSGDGPSQAIEGVGCHEDWLSDSMKESGITIEMLPRLPIGTEIFYRANCADAPPADIAAESAKIRAHERARLKGVANFSRRPGLVARNAELDALRAQVKELKEKFATAGTTAVQAPASKLADKPEEATRKVATLESDLKKAAAERDEAQRSLANLRAREEDRTLSKALLSIIMLLSGGFIVACLVVFSDTVNFWVWRARRLLDRSGDAPVSKAATPAAPIGAPANPPGAALAQAVAGNDSERDGVFTEDGGGYLVQFDGKGVTAKVARSHRGAKNTNLVVEVFCPGDGCPAIVYTNNLKGHLAKCQYWNAGGRRLRPVPREQEAGVAS